ncbi:Voltage-dependent anion-selective channel protein 1 [Microtus ochrogaster]|uniref:Voltage-dependent anion-selective channel protein 1 n=1 Tax=Microtus ochrogaster TaxID=79684 RepID=A0A8J6GN92_MICOH|nr:Voltage-dependent anion-selective channel protein 1 [Microtus ochrogaster]
MALPPTYADPGKPAKDIVSKGYGFFLIKVDLKTKSETRLEFASSANTGTTKVNGSLETTYGDQFDLYREVGHRRHRGPRDHRARAARVWTEADHSSFSSNTG